MSNHEREFKRIAAGVVAVAIVLFLFGFGRMVIDSWQAQPVATDSYPTEQAAQPEPTPAPQPKPPPEVKVAGLSQATRRQIWDAGCRAEDQAMVEADRRCPITPANDPAYLRMTQQQRYNQVMNNVKLVTSLQAKARHRTARHWGITDKQYMAISVEGATNRWPLPPLPAELRSGH